MSYYFRMKNVNNFSMALIIKVLLIKKGVSNNEKPYKNISRLKTIWLLIPNAYFH